MKRLTALLVCLCCLVPGLVSAQQASPSDGVPLPDTSLATQSDSASLEVNPAGLGYIRGIEASYGFFLPSPDYQLVVPTGHSLTLGMGGVLGAIGLGAQWVEDRRLGSDRFPFQKYTIGGATSPTRLFSVGGNVNYFASRTDERLNDLRTVDMGMQFRPTTGLGLGVMARDISPAFLDPDQALPLRLGVGLALRGFDGRLVIDNEAHLVQGADRFEYRPRLAIEPVSGLRAFGHAEIGVPLPGREGMAQFDGFSVGMEMSFGQGGLQGAGYFGQFGTSESTAVTGVAGRAWMGTQPKRSLLPERPYWVSLDLDDTITEQAMGGFFAPPTQAYLGLINDIDAMAEDPAVTGVVLNIGPMNLGFGQLWEFHDAMERLHDAGKYSIAIIHTEAPTTRTIYAAAAADEIWMAPNTIYGPTGLNAELISYAGLLDRIGVEAEFMRIGDYKSAPESLVLAEPSEPALEQTNAYLDAIYDELTTRIAERRGMEPDEFRAVVDATPLFPAAAKDRGLIDEILYSNEVDDELRERITSRIDIGYERVETADQRWGRRPEIAVVYIDGVITSGESGMSPFGGQMITGAETLKRLIGQLADNNNVKAVVLRIDSPGGSAVASDEIYRAIRELAQEKPVIASMGNVAASGGYYVAAAADEIYATPVTLTGSIGIYTGKFNFQSLAQRFGIGTHFEPRGERAGVFSAWRPWTDSEREGVALTLEYLYHLFLQQVARNRPLSPDEVDEAGRGRVWTGQAAVEQGLVDEIGGITDALRRAEELAGVLPGQAYFRDRSGAAGALLSPGMTTGLRSVGERLGLVSATGIATPEGQIIKALEGMESSLIWPLYFDSGEAVFLMPYQLSYD